MVRNADTLRPSGTITVTGFVALTLPMLPAHRTVSRLQGRVPHPFREPVQSIVMGVMSGTFPYTYGVST
jgi:hypothetical protein